MALNSSVFFFRMNQVPQPSQPRAPAALRRALSTEPNPASTIIGDQRPHNSGTLQFSEPSQTPQIPQLPQTPQVVQSTTPVRVIQPVMIKHSSAPKPPSNISSAPMVAESSPQPGISEIPAANDVILQAAAVMQTQGTQNSTTINGNVESDKPKVGETKDEAFQEIHKEDLAAADKEKDEKDESG